MSEETATKATKIVRQDIGAKMSEEIATKRL